jgi:hypothetical protein
MTLSRIIAAEQRSTRSPEPALSLTEGWREAEPWVNGPTQFLSPGKGGVLPYTALTRALYPRVYRGPRIPSAAADSILGCEYSAAPAAG